MRHAVTTPAYLFRKTLDNVLFALSTREKTDGDSRTAKLSQVAFPSVEPRGWLPLYTMVTFRPDISYATAKRKVERQSHILAVGGWAASAVLSATAVGITWLLLSQRLGRKT